VTVRRCTGGEGHAAVLMAGWRITEASTQAWAQALESARLAALGVSTLYAVEGPADVDFRAKELAVDALLEALAAGAREPGAWVLAVAHSSGAHVAATLFDRAFRVGRAPALRDRVVYVDLDGDRSIAGDPERTLSAPNVEALRHALFVGVNAGAYRGLSWPFMAQSASDFGPRSELVRYDGSDSGCASNLCAHLSLVNRRPYARGNESYSRFEQGAVNTAWLDRAERWLHPALR